MDPTFEELASMGVITGGPTADRFMLNAGRGHLSDPLDVLEFDDDETDSTNIQESERDWDQVLDKVLETKRVRSKSDKTPEIESMLITPSTQQLAMSRKVMTPARQELTRIISRSPSDHVLEAERIVKNWAKQENRKLAPPLIKALTSAIVTNESLELRDFDSIILGWDLRGDHNVNEVKNVTDSQQRALNEILAAQRDSKGSLNDILNKMNEAYGRILSLHERSIPIGIAVPFPDPQPTPAGTSTTKKRAEIPTFGEKKLISSAENVSEDKVLKPRPKTVNNLLWAINRTRAELCRYVPDQHLDGVLKSFVSKLTDYEWTNLPNENKKNGPTILKLAKCLNTAMVFLLAEEEKKEKARLKALSMRDDKNLGEEKRGKGLDKSEQKGKKIKDKKEKRGKEESEKASGSNMEKAKKKKEREEEMEKERVRKEKHEKKLEREKEERMMREREEEIARKLKEKEEEKAKAKEDDEASSDSDEDPDDDQDESDDDEDDADTDDEEIPVESEKKMDSGDDAIE